MLEVLGIKNIGKLIPAAEDEKPKDPVTENMAIINCKPVKAFIYQDHEAHIAVHKAFMEDPKIQQMVGQNPKAQEIQGAIMAHMNEHIAYAYRKQIEEQLGVELPNPEDAIPKEIEMDISKAVAMAAQQLLQKNQAEMQQQQAQQTAQDPLVQMQQQELQLKQQEVQIKAQKAQADIEIDKAKLQVDIMRIQSEERKAGANLGLKSESEKAKLKADQEKAGVQMGIDIAKTKSQQSMKQTQKPTGETE
jgi:hypothetical protein